MTAAEQDRRRALKRELRTLDRRVEALTEDYELRAREQRLWFSGDINNVMHVRNSGPRHELQFRAKCELERAQHRMEEIRAALRGSVAQFIPDPQR